MITVGRGVDLSQLNMCSGRFVIPKGSAPENEGRQYFKSTSVKPIGTRRNVSAKEESSLMRPFWDEVADISTNLPTNSRY